MHDDSRQRLTDRFVELVEHLNRQLHSGPKEEWGDFNLTIPQIKALSVLQHGGPMRMGEIARQQNSTLSATSTIVDRLVNKGLVARGTDPDDRRVVVCELTAQGHEAAAKLWRIGRVRILPLLAQMDDAQLGFVVAGLEVLAHTAAETLGTASVPPAAD